MNFLELKPVTAGALGGVNLMCSQGTARAWGGKDFLEGGSRQERFLLQLPLTAQAVTLGAAGHTGPSSAVEHWWESCRKMRERLVIQKPVLKAGR